MKNLILAIVVLLALSACACQGMLFGVYYHNDWPWCPKAKQNEVKQPDQASNPSVSKLHLEDEK